MFTVVVCMNECHENKSCRLSFDAFEGGKVIRRFEIISELEFRFAFYGSIKEREFNRKYSIATEFVF
jgi:hypothetical protein